MYSLIFLQQGAGSLMSDVAIFSNHYCVLLFYDKTTNESSKKRKNFSSRN